MGKHNLNNYLDEGIIKYVDTNYMPIDYLLKYTNEYSSNDDLLDPVREWNSLKRKDHELEMEITNIMKNEKDPYKAYELSQRVEKRRSKLPPCPTVHGYKDMKPPSELDMTEILRYYGLEPFNRSIMINISPNWKGKGSSMENKLKYKFLHIVMKKFYENCNRFSNGKYVIECGKDCDFIHVHAVFEINQLTGKSTLASQKKGNLLRDLRVLWNKASDEYNTDFKGLIDSKHALQSTLINHREILKDKLNYLIEELKPESHQNGEHPQFPQIVSFGDW